MFEQNQKIWSRFHQCAVLHEDETCRTVIAENEAGERIIVYEVSFDADTPTAVRMRLEYETARLATLPLTGIALPLDFEFNEKSARIACPWTAGRTLADRIAAAEVSIADAINIADDILTTLSEIHQEGLIRRCLRPTEIFVEEAQGRTRAVIGGYSPLMILQAPQNATLAREMATYASPEALGALEEDVRVSADLYSLGIVLFECLTGRVPFSAEDAGDLVFQHMTAPIPDLTLLNPKIPRLLNDIVQRLLQKHPRDRYQSAVGVRFDIRQISAMHRGQHLPQLILGTMDCRETLIEPAFVGRTSDLCVMESELNAVSQGNSRTLLVTANSGLGKSRLLLEISRMAVSAGYRVLRGQGHNQIGLAPLTSLRGTLSQCIEAIRQDADLKAQLHSELSEFTRELHAVVPELAAELSMQFSAAGSDELSDRRIAVALATLLGSLGTPARPVLILLDDMQWADDLTLSMLECWHLTAPRHVLLIVATRPAEATAERLRENLKCAGRMVLEPLNREEIDQLLGSMAGGLPAQILKTVWEMSTGNPFVASAVLRGLVEGGVLTPSPSGWLVDNDKLKNLQMSGEAAEVLKQRLYRLPTDSQNLLAVGSVLGKEFSIEMAAALAEVPRDQVLQLLVEPRRNYLIWERASGSICSFMHDQIREAVLQSLTPQRRADIHRRAADYLVQHEAHRIFDIAFHYDAAGRSDLAGSYAVEAAERARGSHALETAEQQYRIALRSSETLQTEPEFTVLYGLGDVLMLCGRYQEAEPLFERAILAADSPTTRAQLTLKLGELAFKEDQKARAIELWESALSSLGGKLPPSWLTPIFTVREILVQVLHTMFPKRFLAHRGSDPSTDNRLIWRLHSRLAYAYWFVRSKLDVLHVHLRGMNLAERYQPTAELAQAYSEHAPAMSLIPLSRRGIAYGRRSLQIRTEQNDVWGQGQSLHFLAIALYSASQFEECVEVGRRSVRILDRAGDFWEKHIAQYQVAASLYRLGRFTEAVQLSREAYDSGLAVGDYQVCGNIIEVWARATNGEVPAKILECELERPRSDVQGQAHVLLARGVQLISEQRFEDAVQAFDQGIDAASAAGISNTYTSPLFAWRATAYRGMLENKSPLTRNPRRKVIRAHRRAARQALLVALRFRNELPHALREYAWAQLFLNRNRRAIFLLKQSVSTAERQSAEYEVIQSELLLQKIRLELAHRDAEKALEQAERRHSAFRSEQLPQRMFASLSLVDRFDSLLESGRSIASAIQPEVIVDTAAAAARRLLRSNHCEVIALDDNGQPSTGSELIRSQILTSLKTLDAVASCPAGSEFRSLLVCPITVRGRTVSCLIVGNSEVRDLFGPNELRIARYLTTIAGAALENAEGFRSLQDLNTNLERIVDERTSVVEARSRELMETAESLRRTQAQLAAARDAAESASRAKSDFLAHMSHEIRTPIGAVLGFTELLLYGDAPLQSEQRSHLHRVLSNGNHLHRLLNDLLDLSRIEAGELTIETMECSPYVMLHDILAALQSRAIAKSLRLVLNVVGTVPEKIQTDPTRLRQILTNLIGNAIKFTEQGSVTLIVETETAKDQLRIHVQDTGPGIPESARNDVFEPFKQADDTVARRFGGTGLGLPISRRLARALGGDIELSSEPGYGSTFTVTIATGSLAEVRLLSQQEAEATLTAPVGDLIQQVNLQGFRILIADDVEANREFFAHTLRRAKAECLFAENGREAVDHLLQDDEIDLVLMDMQMPEMDGYTATETLRTAGILIPVVAVTANGTKEDRQRCRQAGCSGYLTKPISISGLLQGVAEQLGLSLEDSTSPAPVISPELRIASDYPQVRRRDETLPGDPVFRNFAVRFLQKIEEVLPQIIAAVNHADSSRISEWGHWLKGTGGTVGLPGFTELGRVLEEAAASRDFVAARTICSQLQTSLERLQSQSSL